jgi:hypothetical protein
MLRDSGVASLPPAATGPVFALGICLGALRTGAMEPGTC